MRARAASSSRKFVRLGTPDGGVEGYAIDEDDGEHGIQAKFFLARPTTAQWRDITDSIERAIRTHPLLVEMTIALPTDRADPRKPGEQWFMDEWENKENEWRAWALAAGRSVTFSYLGKSEIADALSLEEHAGRYKWWFDQHLLSGRWLEERLQEAISQAGPRYNRDLTVTVPAGRRIALFARSPRLLGELDRLAKVASDKAVALAAALPSERAAELLATAANLPRPVSGTDPVLAASVTPPFAQWLDSWKSLAIPPRDAVAHEDERGDRTVAGRAFSALSEALESATTRLYEDAPAYQASAMLLWGDAGQGKTHLLCDTGVQALNRGQPAVVILGQQLGPGPMALR